MHHLDSSAHAPLHFVAVVARAAFFPCFFDDRRTQGESILCSVLSPPLPIRCQCLRSLLGHLRPWGVVVVEADVGRAALFVRLRVFGTQAPFLGVLRTFPPCHRSPQIGHTLGLSIPSVAARHLLTRRDTLRTATHPPIQLGPPASTILSTHSPTFAPVIDGRLADS